MYTHTQTHIHNTPRYRHQFTVKRCCSLAPCSTFSPIHFVCPLLHHIISAATSLWICEWSGTQIVTRSMLWITALMCSSSCVWITRWQEGFVVMWKERSLVWAGCITETFIFVTNRDVFISVHMISIRDLLCCYNCCTCITNHITWSFILICSYIVSYFQSWKHIVYV